MCCPICGKESLSENKNNVRVNIFISDIGVNFTIDALANKSSTKLCSAHFSNFCIWASNKKIKIHITPNKKPTKKVSSSISAYKKIHARVVDFQSRVNDINCPGCGCEDCDLEKMCKPTYEILSNAEENLSIVTKTIKNFYASCENLYKIEIDDSFFAEWVSVKLKSLIKRSEDGKILEYCQHLDCGNIASIKNYSGNYYCSIHARYYTKRQRKHEIKESLIIKHAKLIIEEIKNLPS